MVDRSDPIAASAYSQSSSRDCDRGVSLGSSPHGNLCRLSPPLWGILRGGQLAGKARRGTSCRSRRRIEDLPGSQTGRTVPPLAKEKGKIRIKTYEGGARTKIS